MPFLWSASSLFLLLMEYAYRWVCVYIDPFLCVSIYVTRVRWCEVSCSLRVQWESSYRLLTGEALFEGSHHKVSPASFSFICVTVDGFYPSFSVPHILVILLLYVCTSNCVAAAWDYGAPAGLDCWVLHSLVFSYVGQEEVVSSACMTYCKSLFKTV